MYCGSFRRKIFLVVSTDQVRLTPITLLTYLKNDQRDLGKTQRMVKK
jgi:hypothetical protein